MRTKRDGASSVVPSASTGPLNYLPEIDGLRALAVLAVLGYHFGVLFDGGYLGVDLFMVLSGFLITRLIVAEQQRTGGLDLWEFWSRRARRLIPAALVLVVVCSGLAAWLYDATSLGNVRGDALAAILYVANWRFIASGQSYFDLFAETSPFRHLWSLAIEEQFYVAWPLVLFVVRGRTARFAVTVAAIAASTTLMWVLTEPLDPSRSYYGTDTRAHSLLIGALAAMLLVGPKGSQLGVFARRLLPWALASAVGAMLFVGDDVELMYRGGFAAFAVLSAVVVIAAASPGSGSGMVSRLLMARPLVIIGKGSYSLYLWHWPAAVFVTEARIGVSGLGLSAVQAAASGLAAAASYRWVEQPLRHRSSTHRRVAVATIGAVAVSGALVAVFTSGATQRPQYFDAGGEVLVIPTRTEAGSARHRVLLVGDSVAASLVDGLLAEAPASADEVFTAPVSGCGLLPGTTLGDLTLEPWAPSAGCAATVDAAVNRALAEVRPDVVVWVSVWDAEHREIDGQQLIVGRPDDDAKIASLIRDRLDLIRSAGASTVLVTNPPVGAVELTDISRAKNDRLRAYNRILTSIAADRDDVELLELDKFICPAGAPCDDLAQDGTRYRPADGIHYDAEGAARAAAWMLSQLDAAK